MLKEASLMIAENVQFQQQTTGVTDHMMGTTLGRGITETARGATIVQQNSLQKFNLIVMNIMPSMISLVKFVIILFNKFAPNSKRVKHFGVKSFVKTPEHEIEADYKLDFYFKNMAQDLDRRRAQFLNAVNVFGNVLMQAGGDVKEMIKLVLESFDLKTREIQEVLGETPEAKERIKEQQAMAQFFNQMMQGGGGKTGATSLNAQAQQTESAPEEAQAGEQGSIEGT
jgi:hypothetical protein